MTRMSGKMTRTFDAKSYTELLVSYQPKPIATEAENQQAIALAQELEHRSPRTVEEELFLELLLVLIEKFEEENYPISKVNYSLQPCTYGKSYEEAIASYLDYC
jgi:HTH-type transcriptional regulator / antitoxin HigA